MCTPGGPERSPILCILPPHMLRHLARLGGPEQRRLAEWAHETLVLTERMRGQRAALGGLASLATAPAGRKRRTVYDARGAEALPGRLVRGEGDPPSGDAAVDEAYDGAGATYDFYSSVFGRNSVDDRGMRLDSTVHYGQRYDNAFWNGVQMVYGDGDGVLFKRFTKCIDVIGHELTHGVTQNEAALDYQGQSGALNESYSDVIGSLVKQYTAKQTADEADWLIGAGLFTPAVKGVALRSMKQPGTAYDDPRLGRDPQPADMKHFVKTRQDSGGVHINSGIPNRAFCLAALAFGGHAWEKAGRIWYVTLRDRLRSNASFADAAKATVAVAGETFDADAALVVTNAWKAVGVLPRSAGRAVSDRAAGRRKRKTATKGGSGANRTGAKRRVRRDHAPRRR